MVAGHVEMVLFEQSMANADGIQQPFSDRVIDAAEKTAGAVLFDVRVDGDANIYRMAAIGYGDADTAIVVLEKSGQLRCASVNGAASPFVAALAAWEASPLSEHVRADYHGTALILLAKLRAAGHLK
ncbi:hypothetical protein FJ978_10680 [Mesorhizobium sp. B1-1-7]|uniref:Uncharacterized protein n=2 Tax=Mesorhizobium TaxID=68287 RepID=F7Y5R7_MESOW|nr:conserved hypothetical protein [Mesorhizobium opportunistum WSM2075]TPN53232.1 hypothetical protein FJ978_10680 [Mesorhizobium sp. B1-1-7]